MPLRHIGNVQLLVEHHVDRVPHEAPAVGIDDQGENAGSEDAKQTVSVRGRKGFLIEYPLVESEQAAKDIQPEETEPDEPTAVQVDPEAKERGKEP